ncbi:hypothetical protein LV779_21550 [Streptomyces thinghirensis]|nr:hypothetical protein [Streptomyces thinghirensis]
MGRPLGEHIPPSRPATGLVGPSESAAVRLPARPPAGRPRSDPRGDVAALLQNVARAGHHLGDRPVSAEADAGDQSHRLGGVRQLRDAVCPRRAAAKKAAPRAATPKGS